MNRDLKLNFKKFKTGNIMCLVYIFFRSFLKPSLRTKLIKLGDIEDILQLMIYISNLEIPAKVIVRLIRECAVS